MQKGGERLAQRHAVARGHGTNGHGIRNILRQQLKNLMRPCACGGNEGVTQKHGLPITLRRTGERAAKISRFAEC